MIKLKTILEIGEPKKPKNINFKSMSLYETVIEISVGDLKYTIDIRTHPAMELLALPMIGNMFVDFYVSSNKDKYQMTNKGNALEVMSNIMGAIVLFFDKYYKSFIKNSKYDDGTLMLKNLGYNPKYEHEDDTRRDRIYRMYIKKLASKHKSKVSFSESGGITAIFNPPLTLRY